jgi:dipeptidyl-peptidase 4
MRLHHFCLAISLTLGFTAGCAAAPAVPPAKLTLERLIASPSLSGPGMQSLKISPDGSRVAFLRAKPEDRLQMDLWEYHLEQKTMRRLIDSKILQPKEEISAEEQARRERNRNAGLRGIVDFNWSPDGKQILLPLADQLFLVDIAQPEKARSLTKGQISDAKISPKGRYVSFLRAQNLFVIDTRSGQERQLTHDGKSTIHNAEQEFVAQEEMNQHSGYWWAPDDSAIAFKRFDESAVSIAQRLEIHANRSITVEQRYPYAGGANVKVSLHLVAPDAEKDAIREIDLGKNPDIYLARVNWRHDAKEVWFQRQSRDHKQLDLIAVNATTLAQRVVLTEKSTTWVELHDDLHFLKQQDGLIWASDRNGFKHLYLYRFDGTEVAPLTSGAWNVEQVLNVDEATRQIYLASNKDDVTESQVYAATLGSVQHKNDNKNDAKHDIRRITQQPGWHKAVFSKDGKWFIDHFSAPDTPPQVAMRRADNQLITWLERNELNEQHPYAPFRANLVTPEYGTLAAEDGQLLYYELMKPAQFDPQKRYPVMVEVYGGPGLQMVSKRWQGGSHAEYMTQQGYIVFRLDNRGSARRERKFTDVIYRNLGQHEVADQLRGIDWLRQQSFVDPKRIAVTGGSYGGFMTLRLLAAAPDKIAAGMAHASPIDWHLYDTYYTEHYLGHPKENEQAYAKSGVLPYLKTINSPLLVTHGMADDNVLFTNATGLMQTLNQQGTLYELMTYPGERHGIRSQANRLHYYRTKESFLARHMGSNPAGSMAPKAP